MRTINMTHDMTEGAVMKSMLIFAVPMILGNLLQQGYNIADTFIVGQFLGANALAAVGSAFTLMTFLTSILLGLCMGSGNVFSIRFGERNETGLKESICASFVLIAGAAVFLNILAFLLLDNIAVLLQVPDEVWGMMREYLKIIFCGIMAVFLYNYFASFLRAVGNSFVPLIFLGVSAVCNIVLDLLFVLGFSFLTCVQQSVMNLGILMVQGLVNSFGSVIMAAFAAAVKIDAFAYMPVQDFGNAFSTFISQNYGAKKEDRIRKGLRGAVIVACLFSVAVSAVVWIFARPLMELFVGTGEPRIVAEGVRYLRIEGAFYCGIGCLFLLYGLYRALGKPGMSVILTFVSLGTRVVLAYVLSSLPSVGVVGIWWSVPVGWFLADAVGLICYFRGNHRKI